jgi:hypothetical protein
MGSPGIALIQSERDVDPPGRHTQHVPVERCSLEKSAFTGWRAAEPGSTGSRTGAKIGPEENPVSCPSYRWGHTGPAACALVNSCSLLKLCFQGDGGSCRYLRLPIARRSWYYLCRFRLHHKLQFIICPYSPISKPIRCPLHPS